MVWWAVGRAGFRSQIPKPPTQTTNWGLAELVDSQVAKNQPQPQRAPPILPFCVLFLSWSVRVKRKKRKNYDGQHRAPWISHGAAGVRFRVALFLVGRNLSNQHKATRKHAPQRRCLKPSLQGPLLFSPNQTSDSAGRV